MTQNLSEHAREPADEPLDLALRFCSALMSEELAHEFATPLRFLERLMTGLRAGTHPETKELDLALGEIVRLRRLVTTLREAKPPPILAEPLVLREVVELAHQACSRVLGPGILRFVSTIEATWVVSAHRGALHFVLRAMTQAVLGEEAPRQAVEVEASTTATPSELVVILTGASGDSLEAELLVPWNTKASNALPLSVAWRIARAQGFRLEFATDAPRRRARLVIPRSRAQCLRADSGQRSAD